MAYCVRGGRGGGGGGERNEKKELQNNFSVGKSGSLTNFFVGHQRAGAPARALADSLRAEHR